MEKFLGVRVWQRRWKSRRYQVIAGLFGIADGVVRVMSFGWLMPSWQFEHVLRDHYKESSVEQVQEK